jgi:putative membrane-bound dehydrogenase-like protein
MRVPEGFHVDLFAGEPDVTQPVALCLDDRGRLWVAENHSYPDHGDAPRADRIVILEDTDGDGRADTRRVFHDRLNYVTGIETGFGGVWVVSPPHFHFIPDRNGDDVPDGAPETLLDGLGNHANAHNLANNLAWGPDGWLYGTHGRTNWSLIGPPGTPEAERVRFDGGVYRYHPVRRVWESFADGCTNPWGIDWDDHGEAFIPNTVDPHLFHAIQGAHYEPWRNRESSRYAYRRLATIADHLHFLGGRNIRAGLGTAEEDQLGGGHSHCGILVYLGDNWPERYRNTVLLHNTHGRRVNHDLLRRSGSGYVATHAPDFLRAADPWFMGVNFRTGPDGTVFVTDWSDTGECHSTRNTRKHTGRIFRIRHGNPAFSPVDLAAASDDDLVRRQLHRNDWHVRHARRLLQERAARGLPMDSAHAALRAILADHPEVPRKLRALWALHVTGGLAEPDLLRLLEHDAESVRAWAVRLLGEPGNPPDTVVERLARLAAEDPSPRVRLHLSSVLQRIDPPRRWDLATALIARSEDGVDPNLPLLHWYGIEPLVHEDVPRFAALVRATAIPLLRNHLARRLASLPDPGPGLASLAALLPELDEPGRAPVLEGLKTGLTGRADVSAPPGWDAVTAAAPDDPAVLELGALFRDPDALARLRDLALDPAAAPDRRLRAFDILLPSLPADSADWLLARLADPVLQPAVLRGLARFPSPATAARILDLYPALPDVATRRDALQALASRPDWASRLLDAVAAGTVPRSDLTTYTVRQIESLGDASLSGRVADLWGETRPTSAAKRERIARLAETLPPVLARADLPAGRVHFQTLCAACHRLFGEGGGVGPDLTGAQRSSLAYLLENIVDPGASLARDYRMQLFELEDGRLLTGFTAAETETTLTIRTLNEELVTPRAAIRRVTTSPVSLMPEGLLDALDATGVRDLLGYLQSPVPLPPRADG